MQEKLNFVLLSIWSHIPIDLSVWASNIVYQREIWSLPTGAVDTICHGQSRIMGKIARKNDKNKSISLKLKYFLIAGAHNLKLICSATYCNMTTKTPCFSRFPIDLTWQPFQHGTTPRFETGNDGGATAPWESWIIWRRRRRKLSCGKHHPEPMMPTEARSSSFQISWCLEGRDTVFVQRDVFSSHLNHVPCQDTRVTTTRQWPPLGTQRSYAYYLWSCAAVLAVSQRPRQPSEATGISMYFLWNTTAKCCLSYKYIHTWHW